MTLPIISTKLSIPKITQNTISRTGLLEKLSEGVASKLTLISAPTGYGKTTLVADWLAGPGQKFPVAWVTLDEAENDPRRFLLYFVASLQEIRDDLGEDALAVLHGSQEILGQEILSILINEINEMEGDIVLVLDDYHLIDQNSIHEMLCFFLDHLPPQMHIVILTRIDPPLPLARMRAHSYLVEIRARDLAFDMNEAIQFLNIQWDK